MTRTRRNSTSAHHRQMFLTEQGYAYDIRDEREFVRPKAVPHDAPPPVCRRNCTAGFVRPHGRRPCCGRVIGSKKTRRRRDRPLSDRVLLIRPGRVPAVVDELKKNGAHPQVIGKPTNAPAGSDRVTFVPSHWAGIPTTSCDASPTRSSSRGRMLPAEDLIEKCVSALGNAALEDRRVRDLAAGPRRSSRRSRDRDGRRGRSGHLVTLAAALGHADGFKPSTSYSVRA